MQYRKSASCRDDERSGRTGGIETSTASNRTPSPSRAKRSRTTLPLFRRKTTVASLISASTIKSLSSSVSSVTPRLYSPIVVPSVGERVSRGAPTTPLRLRLTGIYHTNRPLAHTGDMRPVVTPSSGDRGALKRHQNLLQLSRGRVHSPELQHGTSSAWSTEARQNSAHICRIRLVPFFPARHL